MRQLKLPIEDTRTVQPFKSYYDVLTSLLSSDLNFQENGNGNNSHPAHKTHSFPAKFPAQLPRKFITELTKEGDVILDPMMGSGTTLLESYIHNRQVVGFDIDPLAVLLTKVKVQYYDSSNLKSSISRITENASRTLRLDPTLLDYQKEKRFDTESIQFIDYWFAKETQMELLALLIEIEKIDDLKIREFFLLIFSAIIITKTGGVSLALDLAHTRPHKAKVVVSKTGNIIVDDGDPEKPRHRILTKTLRSPLEEFVKKFVQNLRYVIDAPLSKYHPAINFGNAQSLPLASNSIDLIITSPPYASNAIDYMRAHKFTLVWFGFPISSLTNRRKTYIGGEGNINLPSIVLPQEVRKVIEPISIISRSKGQTLHRYYTEMSLVLSEMYRILKPGKAAIVVVGNSTLAGQDAKIQDCLVEIGGAIGFEIPKVGVRQLDRNKRMLPAGAAVDDSSQIQQRMHEEFVIGFYKPLDSSV